MTDPCDGWPRYTPYGLARLVIPAERIDPICMEGFDPRHATPKLATFLPYVRTDYAHWSYDLEWTLESGTEDAPSCIDIVIPYTYRGSSSDYFSGGCWNPGDPAELETGVPWFVDDTGARCEVSLIPAEWERIELHIYENPPEPPSYEDD